MTTKLLLVDYSNLFYRGANVHTELSHKGSYTGGIFGFFQVLSGLISRVEPTRVIICTDTKPYQRTLDFPGYKAGRGGSNTSKERYRELTHNRKAVSEILKICGAEVVGEPLFEADDIMAILAKKYRYDYDEVILASNDSDLYQLLGQKNLKLYLGTKGYYDQRMFFLDHPKLTKARQWVDVVAICGGHNATPGIYGIGVKTAESIVSDIAVAEKHRLKLYDHRNMIRANKHLCRLPYPPLEDHFHKVSDREPHAPNCNPRDAIRKLTTYGIKTTVTMGEAFDVLARGSNGG